MRALWSARRFPVSVLRRFSDEGFDQASASLAFVTLLSIVPLVAVVLGAMSALPSFISMVTEFDQVMRSLLPERSAGLIVQYVLDFSHKALNVTVAGLLALVATVFTLMHSVEHAFNKAWKAVSKRPWWRRVLLYAALILLWPLAVAYLVAAISYGVSLSSGLIVEQVWLHSLLSKMTGVSVAALFFGGLYFAVPNARVRLRDALCGGFFAAFGFLLMQKGFELYLAYFPAVKVVYGAFATLPIFLLWLYLSWAMILLGALVAVTLPEFRHANVSLPSASAKQLPL